MSRCSACGYHVDRPLFVHILGQLEEQWSHCHDARHVLKTNSHGRMSLDVWYMRRDREAATVDFWQRWQQRVLDETLLTEAFRRYTSQLPPPLVIDCILGEPPSDAIREDFQWI